MMARNATMRIRSQTASNSPMSAPNSPRGVYAVISDCVPVLVSGADTEAFALLTTNLYDQAQPLLHSVCLITVVLHQLQLVHYRPDELCHGASGTVWRIS